MLGPSTLSLLFPTSITRISAPRLCTGLEWVTQKFVVLLRCYAVRGSGGGYKFETMLTYYAADVCVRMATPGSVAPSRSPYEVVDEESSWRDWQEGRSEEICGSMALAGAQFSPWLPVGVSLLVWTPLNYTQLDYLR